MSPPTSSCVPHPWCHCAVPADVAYLRSVLPSTTEDAFFDYLATLDASEVTVTAIPEGSVVFPRVGPPSIFFPDHPTSPSSQTSPFPLNLDLLELQSCFSQHLPFP